MAIATAASLDGIQQRFCSRRPEDVNGADRIARQMPEFDMRGWWSPEAPFLGRLSKAGIATVMQEAGLSADAIKAVGGLPKREAVSLPEREISGSGWLPNPLQTQPDTEASQEPDEDGEGDAEDLLAEEGELMEGEE